MSDHAEEMVLRIPSDFRYLGAVDAAVQDLAREFAFAPDAVNDMTTALIEACSNAIEHGNKYAKDKRVTVTLRFNGRAFTALVRDQGRGFDYEAAMRQEVPPDPMSERGRGLLIMKAFTDSLRYIRRNDGLCCELVKRRSSDPQSAEWSRD
jgi:serine/threonine-protein kinase RsbW